MKKPSLAEKDVLNPSEAAEFYDLSRRKFFRMLDEADGLPFVAIYKTRKLIIPGAGRRRHRRKCSRLSENSINQQGALQTAERRFL